MRRTESRLHEMDFFFPLIFIMCRLDFRACGIVSTIAGPSTVFISLNWHHNSTVMQLAQSSKHTDPFQLLQTSLHPHL